MVLQMFGCAGYAAVGIPTRASLGSLTARVVPVILRKPEKVGASLARWGEVPCVGEPLGSQREVQ